MQWRIQEMPYLCGSGVVATCPRASQDLTLLAPSGEALAPGLCIPRREPSTLARISLVPREPEGWRWGREEDVLEEQDEDDCCCREGEEEVDDEEDEEDDLEEEGEAEYSLTISLDSCAMCWERKVEVEVGMTAATGEGGQSACSTLNSGRASALLVDG